MDVRQSFEGAETPRARCCGRRQSATTVSRFPFVYSNDRGRERRWFPIAVRSAKPPHGDGFYSYACPGAGLPGMPVAYSFHTCILPAFVLLVWPPAAASEKQSGTANITRSDPTCIWHRNWQLDGPIPGRHSCKGSHLYTSSLTCRCARASVAAESRKPYTGSACAGSQCPGSSASSATGAQGVICRTDLLGELSLRVGQ